MKRFLALDLDAPMVSFGSDSVDAIGRVGDFPTQSMITGLLANALGYDRTQTADHDNLQKSLRFGAVIVREGIRGVDYQTASILKSDRAWTTDGTVIAREMGAEGTTIRTREFEADKHVIVILDIEGAPDTNLDVLANAIMFPARPIFVGRKPNLPSGYVSAPGIIEADDLAGALAIAAGRAGAKQPCRAALPATEAAVAKDHVVTVNDTRNWAAGPHTGSRKVRIRRITPTNTFGAAA